MTKALWWTVPLVVKREWYFSCSAPAPLRMRPGGCSRSPRAAFANEQLWIGGPVIASIDVRQ